MAMQANRPTLSLLPDLEGEAGLSEGLGLQVASVDFLAILAQTMDAPDRQDGADVLAMMHRTEQALADRRSEATWRGLLAAVLLWDVWKNAEDSLRVTEVTGDTPFSAMLLAARRPGDKAHALQLVTLEKEGRKAALGIVHGKVGIIPAATAMNLVDFLPKEINWYDAEQGFTDPVDCLNERERTVLTHRLNLLPGESVRRYVSALMQAGLRTSRALAAQEETALQALSARTLAVCGLREFDGLTCRETQYAENTVNPLLQALGIETPAIREVFQPQLTWQWQGVPFARSSAVTGVESPCSAGEDDALAAVQAECTLLHGSARWQRETARKLETWLIEHKAGRSFSPAAEKELEMLQQRVSDQARSPQQPVRLPWPWAEQSQAVAYLVREQLGEALVEGCVAPFADCLTLLPDAAPDCFGDDALARACALPMDDTGMPCLALPPLSEALGKAINARPDVLQPESFSMKVTEMGEVEVSFTLRGEGEVMLTRVYPPEDIVLLQPEETPTVAVWPSVAFPADQWRAYHVYTNGHGLTVSALSEGEWMNAGAHLWATLRTERFPACLMLHRDGRCLGALLNLLPPFQAAKGDSAVIAIDLGMTGTAVALRQGLQSEPMQLPCLVRTVLHGSRPAAFAEEFLSAEKIEGVLPSVAALFRDSVSPTPLVDGHTGVSNQQERTYTSLKWRVDEPARTACLMHLRQTMLTAALCARMHGARDVSWRIALPSDLSMAARAALQEGVCQQVMAVAEDAGMPVTPIVPPVCCLDADLALAAYLKGAGYQRGGFLAMDIGSGSACMMLWLRGMSRPCAVTHLPLGIQTMLLQSLMRQPESLEEDFAGLPDEAARQAVMELAAQLRAARGSRKALERCQLLLDECLGQHRSTLLQCMNATLAQGGMTLVQALLLCGFAWLMATAGLQLEHTWQDATVNDHIPGELPLCLAGRGSLLLTGMPDILQLRLIRFLRLGMREDNIVRQVHLSAPAAPKMEIALGLARAADGLAEDAADAPNLQDCPLPIQSPLLFLRKFLMAFQAEFPLAFQRLYSDLIEEGRLTDAAEIRLRTLVQMQPAQSPASLALCLEQLRDSGN